MRDAALIIHFIGLILGVGTGFAQMFIGIASSKLNTDDAKKVSSASMALGKMGNIGIILLVLSGGYLMTPFWSSLGSNPKLAAKLLLVLVLIVLLVIININAKKFKLGNTDSLKTIKTLGKITLPISLIIMILAVLVFH